MPPLSKADRERAPALAESLADLSRAIDIVNKVGVTQRAVARASGINVGYLSQLLDAGKEKVPTSQTIEKLSRGLAQLADEEEVSLGKEGLAGAVEAVLTAVDQRMGLVRAERPSPGGTVNHDSPAYVRRSCDAVAESLVAGPNDYLIAGPPQSGCSSLAKRVESLAQTRSQQVAYVDLALDRPGHTTVTEVGAAAELVQSILGVSAGGSDWADVSERFEGWLAQSRRTSVVILDNVNAGPPEVVRALLQVLRGWHNKRASALPANEPYRRLATWTAMTAVDVRDVRCVSATDLSLGTTIETHWFTREEVRMLATTYPPATKASRRQWQDDVVEEARSLFAGQPLLTHHYVHGRSVGALTPEEVIANPTSVFHSHLRRLAALIALDGPSAALLVGERRHEPGQNSLLRQMRVVDRVTSDWSCPFYKALLPTYVEEAMRDGGRNG